MGPRPAAWSLAPGDQLRSHRRRAGSDSKARTDLGHIVLAAKSAPIPGAGESSSGVVTHYTREKRVRMPPLLPQEVSRRAYFAFVSNLVGTQPQQHPPARPDNGV